MSDNITVRGFVASEIRSSTTPGGVATASFRMGATERRFDRATSTWVDGNTNWFTVQGYRQLAGNIGCSVKKGQRVIVVGRLKMRSWEKDGRVYHVAEIDAESVGHDLMWGSANFTRMAGSGSQGAGGQPVAANLGPDEGHRDGQHDSRSGIDDERDEHRIPEAADDDGASPPAIFIDGADEEEEVDEETGELTGAA